MIGIRRVFHSIRSAFILENADLDDQRKRFFIGLLLISGTILLPILGVIDLINGETLEGSFEFFVTVLFIIGVIRLARSGNVGRLTMSGFSLLLIYVAASGGAQGTKVFWIFILPHVLLFILGAKEGAVWNLIIVAVVVSLTFTDMQWVFPYTISSIIRFVSVYLTVTLIAFMLELVRQDYRQRMIEEQQHLNTALKEVEKLSVTDALTGVHNRGYLERRLPEECVRAHRYDTELSILLCDIDHFKSVNDRYGHQVGDDVLRQMCTLINDILRQEIDWVARYGGEEFMIVLPETGHGGALIVAERLRSRIELADFHSGDSVLSITSSFGAASYHPSEEDSIGYQDFINKADMNLYQAKEDGRNRVVS